MMKTLTWPQVAALAVTLAVVGTLAWRGVDTQAIVGLVLALLGGLLVGQQGQIKDQTNGNTSAMLDMIRRQSEIIAHSHPPVGLVPDTPTPTPETDAGAPVYSSEHTAG